jgi:GxxExxY protein
MGLIYGDLTHQLIGCLFHVHNSLGVGYDEFTYHKALERRFRAIGIDHRSKEHKVLTHRGRKVREFEADFVNFGKIILELKTLKSNFVRANYIQLISELKVWEMCLGLLVNFGLQKVEIVRIPYTEKSKILHEDYNYIRDCMSGQDRTILARLRDAILYVFATHGLGYGEVTCRKLIEAELDFRRINYQNRSAIEVSYEGETISVFKMKPLLIENHLICDIEALEEQVDFYDIAKIQSYLRALNLKTGVVVNFGKTALEIRGIRV